MAKKAVAAKPASEVPAEMMSKTDAIKALLAKGVTSPKDLSAAAMSEYRLDVTPAYCSMIKTGLKKKKGKRVAGKKGVIASAPKGHSTGNGDVNLENLALRFALRAGSIDAAIAALRQIEG